MVWPLVIAAAAQVGSSLLGSNAAKGAAKTQAAATDKATAEQRRQFDLQRSDTDPYRQAGANALEQLTGQVARSRENFDANAYLAANPDVAADTGRPAIGGIFGNLGASKGWADDPWGHYTEFGSKEGRQFTATQEARQRNFDPQAYLRANPDVAAAGVDPWQHWLEFGQKEGRTFTGQRGELNSPVTAEEVMQDPGYAFGLQQGQQALDRKIAAMGGRVSGNALKAAARFGTDYASTGYNAAYQRKQDRLNRLSALAGIGQTATASSAAAGAQSANAISGLIERQGDASAASRMAQSNIWGSAGNQLAALYGRYGGGNSYADRSSFRMDDPYGSRGYVGGMEGE